MAMQALLLMDLQVGIVDRYGSDPELAGRVRAVADAVRAAGIPVIWVRVEFRDGYPEVSSHNKSFAPIAGTGAMHSGAETAVHPDMGPQADDIEVVKRRVSAFTGSDLDVVLRSREVDTLVLGGIATSGVVLSTVRQAADLDYHLIVLSDACADADDEVHRVLTTKVFPRQADVMTVSEWTSGLG